MIKKEQLHANKSRAFLLGLSVEQRKDIAAEIRRLTGSQTKHTYIYQIGAGIRTPRRNMTAALEIATKRRVRQSDFDREAREKVSA